MSQYDNQYAAASKDGRLAFERGLDASANPFITREGNVLAEMWHSGWATAAGISPLSKNADRDAAKAKLTVAHEASDARVAAAFPEAWARAQTKPGPKRREACRILRRRYEAQIASA